MRDQVLFDLIAGNSQHITNLGEGYFDGVQDSQHPEAVTVCCSDSRVAQERMWNIVEPGRIFTPSNIGNLAWDRHADEYVVDGSLLYPLVHTGTQTAVVVGHTGCGAVTAAYRSVTDGTDGGESDFGHAPGIAKRVALLTPVVEEALDRGIVDATVPEHTAVNRLVEFNVDRQAAFLRNADVVPDEVSVHGCVYDFQDIYGDVRGRAYLIDLDGITKPDAIREALPPAYASHARRLLEDTY